MTTDAFTSVLHSMGVPLQSDDIVSLLNIYDKKGGGVINYDDFISEQKYIHAVSHNCKSMDFGHSCVFYSSLHSNTRLALMMTSRQKRYFSLHVYVQNVVMVSVQQYIIILYMCVCLLSQIFLVSAGQERQEGRKEGKREGDFRYCVLNS